MRLLRLELRLYGRGDGGIGVLSSTGRHVSTIASRKLTNSSDDSTIMLYCGEWGSIENKQRSITGDGVVVVFFGSLNNDPTLVNGPAKRHSPPKPQLCRK